MIQALLILVLQADEVPSWIDRLGDDDVEVRERAAQELRVAGDRAVPALLAAVDSTDPELRSRARGLLEEASRGSSTDSLLLSIDDPLPGDDGRGTATLRVTNGGARPLLVHRPSLGISCLISRPSGGPPFLWLPPGETISLELEGPVFQGPVTLRPYYARATSCPIVRVFRLENADATTTFNLLEDLFLRGSSRDPEHLQFALDPRTNSIIAGGEDSLLESVKEVVAALDRAAPPRPRRIMRFHGDAARLATILEDLLHPAGADSLKQEPRR